MTLTTTRYKAAMSSPPILPATPSRIAPDIPALTRAINAALEHCPENTRGVIGAQIQPQITAIEQALSAPASPAEVANG